VTSKVIVKQPGFFFEGFDIVVDVLFALRTVEPAVVQRLLETAAKCVRLAPDSIQ
jgi:hypothetical protein